MLNKGSIPIEITGYYREYSSDEYEKNPELLGKIEEIRFDTPQQILFNKDNMNKNSTPEYMRGDTNE